MEYGLIGEKLGHSFSKIIHEKLADYTYELCPLTKEEMHEFMAKKDFRAINVTIPYKRDVIPYCDELDESAERIGVVNTIVNTNGKLKGYNTDFSGFLHSIQSHQIDLAGKKVLIFGSGSTSKTATAVANYLGAGEIFIVSRSGGEGNVLTYEESKFHFDADVIINTTPCGMYPNNDDCKIDLTVFTACEAVFDVIYNPLKSRLLKQADEMGIVAVNGLEMLVAQAKYAVEHFLSVEIPDEKIGEIVKELTYDLSNIVLIGMPSCGKTLTGKALTKYIAKEFVDTDAMVVERAGMPIRDIFEQHGEAFFRQLEREAIAQVAKQNRKIIATGGGAVKDPENMLRLQQNGVIVFIDRELQKLVSTQDRPLSKDKDAVAELYRTRYPLYLSYADLRIENNYEEEELTKADMDQLMGEILEGYREIIGNQWA